MKAACLFFLWFTVISIGHADEPPCPVSTFPKPDWIETVKISRTAKPLEVAKQKTQEALRKKIDEYRVICIENGGEAYWYRPKGFGCIATNAPFNYYRCTGSYELECEADDI